MRPLAIAARALVAALVLLPPAAAQDDGSWSAPFRSLIEQARTSKRDASAPGRKMDGELAQALVPVLRGVLDRAQALHVDLFRRRSVYLDVRFFGTASGLSPEISKRLYRSDAYDWAQPDSSGDSVVRFLLARLGDRVDARRVMQLLNTLKNQLVKPSAFHAPALLGGVDPFSNPSMVYFDDGEGAGAVPADVRALGDDLMKEGRASWGDAKKLCGSITYPPSEKGERPSVQNLYYQQECTCMARALREAMLRRGLTPATVGLLKAVQVADASLGPDERKYGPDSAAPHLLIPPFLSGDAAKPEKVGLFKLDSVPPGLPLSASADPDPLVKPTPADQWNFHVAAAFRAGGETYVLDPITSKSAMTLNGWLEKFENPRGKLLVESVGPVP
ncbi:MAG: hypothetical protein ACHQ49_14295 [Elusimicrobiota bacterium]